MKLLGKILAVFRLIIILCLVPLHGFLVSILPNKSHRLRALVIQSFGKTLTWTLGVKITRVGQPSSQHAILISNHRSYADIPILAGLSPVVFLAKVDVANWPLLGWAARKARTVFVDRNDPNSRGKSRVELRTRLEEGLSVLVFSEGTTTARGTLNPLKPGMFHEAAAADLPIQLVYIEFEEDEDSWIGDESVSQHFFTRFNRWHTSVKVVYKDGLMYGNSHNKNPGLSLCESATKWFHEQIIREVGELRT